MNQPLHQRTARGDDPFAPFRVSRTVVRASALAVLLTLALGACGGDSTSPDGGSAPALSLDAASARPQEVVVAQVRGVTVPATPSAGTLGGVAIDAVRLDDSTVAFVVPSMPTGTQQLELVVDGRAFAAPLRVDAPVAIASAESYAGDAIASAVAQVDSLLAAMRAEGSADTAAVVRARTLLATAEDDLTTATVAERVALAGFLAANAEALGIASGSTTRAASLVSAPVAAAIADGACETADGTTLTTYEACSAELEAFLQGHLVRARRVAALGAIVALGAAAGGPIGIVAAGVSLALVATEVNVIYRDAMRRFITPAFEALTPDAGAALRVAGASRTAMAVASGPVFVVGTATSYAISATYSSPTASDASRSSIIASAIALLEGIRKAWSSLPAILGLGQAPAVPSAPARTVVAPVPAAYLQLGTIDPSTVTGSAAVASGDWKLTFGANGIGNDRPFTFQVRYVAPGVTAQPATISATLQPASYPVASVTVTPASPSVGVGSSITLAAQPYDSSGRPLAGRTVTWATSNAGRATVGSSTGEVTGVDSGTVTITATSEGKSASVIVQVTRDSLWCVPDSFWGTYHAVGIQAWGAVALAPYGALPSTEGNVLLTGSFTNTGYVTVTGASLTLNRDGTVQETVTYTTRQNPYSTTPTVPSGSSTKAGQYSVSCSFTGSIVFGPSSDYSLSRVDATTFTVAARLTPMFPGTSYETSTSIQASFQK